MLFFHVGTSDEEIVNHQKRGQSSFPILVLSLLPYVENITLHLHRKKDLREINGKCINNRIIEFAKCVQFAVELDPL